MQHTLKVQSYYRNIKHALSMKVKVVMKWFGFCSLFFFSNLKVIKMYYMQILDGAKSMTQFTCHL